MSLACESSVCNLPEYYWGGGLCVCVWLDVCVCVVGCVCVWLGALITCVVEGWFVLQRDCAVLECPPQGVLLSVLPNFQVLPSWPC